MTIPVFGNFRLLAQTLFFNYGKIIIINILYKFYTTEQKGKFLSVIIHINVHCKNSDNGMTILLSKIILVPVG